VGDYVMPLNSVEKKKIVDTFGSNSNDTGSTAVQVALLTENIRELTEHLKVNAKDFSSKNGLLKMVSYRRRLLRYLERVNEAQYRDVIGRLGLKK
jgi:small subunit ribosomal protein S15